MINELFEQSIGVLPVDLNGHDGQSYLRHFFEKSEALLQSEAGGSAGSAIDVHHSQIVKLGGSAGQLMLKPDFYRGGDTGDDDRDYLENPFGDWQPSDFFLLERVEIKGQRLEPTRDFGYIPVSPYEFDFLNFGGGGGGAPQQAPCSAGSQKIDWNFVKASEGYVDHGYMVYNNDGSIPPNSGVTIASGFDLGQHSVDDIDKIGLPDATESALEGYAKLKGYEAEAYLYTHPAVYLTPEEGALINSWAHSETLMRTVVAYDNATSVGAFYQLPAAAQTAIADAAFQWGALAGSKNSSMRDFWQDVIHQDWTGAISDLRDAASSGYASRRSREASLLEDAMNNGHLKDGSPC